MKQIMEHYGRAVIAGIITIVLLGIVFGISYGKNHGIPKMLGAMANTVLTSSNQMNGTSDAFEKHMESNLVEITVNNSYACVAQEWIAVSDCLTAVDESGQQFAVQAVAGWSAGVTDGTITVSSDGTELYASKAGVYWIKAIVDMDNGQSKNVVVKLLVNEEVIA